MLFLEGKRLVPYILCGKGKREIVGTVDTKWCGNGGFIFTWQRCAGRTPRRALWRSRSPAPRAGFASHRPVPAQPRRAEALPRLCFHKYQLNCKCCCVSINEIMLSYVSFHMPKCGCRCPGVSALAGPKLKLLLYPNGF